MFRQFVSGGLILADLAVHPFLTESHLAWMHLVAGGAMALISIAAGAERSAERWFAPVTDEIFDVGDG